MARHAHRTVTSSQRSAYHLLNLNEGKAHSPYEAEREILRLIARGDEERARERLGAFFGQSYPKQDKGTFARNPLKQAEYTVVAFGALVCRAIIEGGVDPLVAYDWSDLWSLRVSEAKGLAEYRQLLDDVLHDACGLVRQSQQDSAQPICVRRAKQYVYQHLNQKIGVRDVASALNLSASYLSWTFHEEEGVTLKAYIVDQKVEAAKQLLDTTDDPVGDIACRLAFSSASHFADVFRRQTGMTPRAWRKTHRSVDWRDAHR